MWIKEWCTTRVPRTLTSDVPELVFRERTAMVSLESSYISKLVFTVSVGIDGCSVNNDNVAVLIVQPLLPLLHKDTVVAREEWVRKEWRCQLGAVE